MNTNGFLPPRIELLGNETNKRLDEANCNRRNSIYSRWLIPQNNLNKNSTYHD